VLQREASRYIGRGILDPKSAGALIALSYAQQANFDLEGARNTLRQAVELNPTNALALGTPG
jgi:Flp pilus assembly protein TadD